jgi:putative transposase
MCQVLGVSESGFYAWRKRPASQRKREDAHLTQEIRQVFEKHQGRYGSPRIHRELRDQGRSLSRKRVARLMCAAERAARRTHRRVLTTKRDATHPVAAHVLNRELTATEPNTKWVTDITSIPTTQGWLSLAVILDLYSRAVVGGPWRTAAMSSERKTLCIGLCLVAVPKRVGCITVIAGVKTAAEQARKRLEQMAAVVSMSRKGNCWDHAAMESFFGSLKEECVGNTIYLAHEQARRALFAYLEIYYNRIRRHSTLGYVSPLVYEQLGNEQTKKNV